MSDPPHPAPSAFTRSFNKAANWVSHATGKPVTFMLCVATVLAWAVSGPFFGFSENWQLIINTGTTIVTFLMVFLIQNTQNRDGAAIQAKLDELIRTSAAANAYIGIERLTEEELQEIRDRCEARAQLSATAADRAEEKANRRAARAVERATT